MIEAKKCPVCGGDVPPTKVGGRPRIYDTVRCRSLAASRAFEERKRQGIPSRPRGLIDITGQRFGSLVVVELHRRERSHTIWLCRCDCGATTESDGWCLRNGRSTRCRGCRATSAAAKAPNAERGRCSWCKRAALRSTPYECAACQRQANRRGRDATGRPLARGPRPVLGEPRSQRQEVATA